jgi:transcription elongation factor Elf1
VNPTVTCPGCRQQVQTRLGVPRETQGHLFVTHLNVGVKCWKSGEQATTDIDIYEEMLDAEVAVRT